MTNGRESDYDNWAWLYNRTLGPDYCRQKLNFLERTLLPTIPEGGRVLDLCCGTGQMVAPLLESGFHVTGLDGSADMLRFAWANAPKAEFVQADARTFEFSETFHGVLCTSASLNHISSLDELRQVFTRVNHCLSDKGGFVFDLNHPAQLTRYWRGQPAEGEIHSDCAWLITPRYDATHSEGSFTVDIYRQPDDELQKAPVKRLLGTLVNHRLLTRLRLRLLARFDRFQPSWEHRATTYPVYGHDLQTVESLLRESGFEASVRTLDGEGPVDERHEAYFVCRKVAAAGQPAQIDHVDQIELEVRSGGVS